RARGGARRGRASLRAVAGARRLTALTASRRAPRFIPPRYFPPTGGSMATHKFVFGALALAVSSLVASHAFAAFDACILIKQAGKEFEGTSKKIGHLKNSSVVYAVSHQIQTPFDPGSGSVTHRRQHGLFQVEMAIDASVYQLYNAIIDKDKD